MTDKPFSVSNWSDGSKEPRRYATFDEANRYARRVCQRERVNGIAIAHESEGLLATVSRDAYERTWTDLTWHGSTLV